MVWVYGFFQLDKFYWFSIDLREEEVFGEEELLKCRLIDDDDDNDDSLRHCPIPKDGERGKIIETILVTSNMYLRTPVVLNRFVYIIGGTDPYIIPLLSKPCIQCLDTTNVD